MKCLAFPAPHGQRVRHATFERRSGLAVSAACVVANGVREQLGRLYGMELRVRLFEPVIPSVQGWNAIAKSALLYRMRGSASDAMVVLRPRDALALAGLAFGESTAEERPLSVIERAVLDRAVSAVASTCASVCAPAERMAPEPASELVGFLTYVELQIEGPAQARIGIALAREPQQAPAPGARIEDLLDVQLELSVRTAEAVLPAGAVAALELGTIVPITKDRVLRASVLLAGTRLAGGECGVRDGRYAVAIDRPENIERSS